MSYIGGEHNQNSYLNNSWESKHELADEEIAKIWMDINAKLYSKFEVEGNTSFLGARGACIIKNNKWKSIQKSNSSYYRLKKEQRIPILNKVIDSNDKNIYHYEFLSSMYEIYNL